MRHELTPDELAMVGRVISRCEKRARRWKSNRWPGLAVYAIWFACGIVFLHLSDSFASRAIRSLKAPSVEDTAAKPATLGDIDRLRAATLDSSLMLSTYSFGLTLSWLNVCAGICGVVFTLAKWNRHKEDADFAKILRLLTEESAGAP